ncbi:VPLPA-CTERM sorting domain-containing protein [uncultured Albimonas sp.]|uniref:VPLPA-CTERM sorting domain-containing protein n=1 Tax=uncultured Albimonas sp. TaxID=1331701 RepID=UPI0030EF6C34|tara:strand:- start:443 stop:1306 length:864 start_codon:yes stop_codon:yes gene_type:complete
MMLCSVKTAAVSAAIALAMAGPASAYSLTNGELSVNQLTNGAIDAFTFGEDFYNPGTSLSDWGLMDETGFASATTEGGVGTGLAFGTQTGVDSTSATAVGTFNGAWSFTRTFVLDPVEPLLTVILEVTRTAAGSGSITMFETADPDQGGSSSTTNDVLTQGGLTVAQAIGDNGRTAAFATGGSLVGFGGYSFGLGITSESELVGFLSSPFDPDGDYDDVGFAAALTATLAQGESATLTTWWSAGENAADALAALPDIEASPVPVPAAAPLLAGALGALALLRRRRRG